MHLIMRRINEKQVISQNAKTAQKLKIIDMSQTIKIVQQIGM